MKPRRRWLVSLLAAALLGATLIGAPFPSAAGADGGGTDPAPEACDTADAIGKARAAFDWHSSHGSDAPMFWRILNTLDADSLPAKPAEVTDDTIAAADVEAFSNGKKWKGWAPIVAALECTEKAAQADDGTDDDGGTGTDGSTGTDGGTGTETAPEACDTADAIGSARAAFDWHDRHGSLAPMFWRILNTLDADSLPAKPAAVTDDTIAAADVEAFSSGKAWKGWAPIVGALECTEKAAQADDGTDDDGGTGTDGQDTQQQQQSQDQQPLQDQQQQQSQQDSQDQQPQQMQLQSQDQQAQGRNFWIEIESDYDSKGWGNGDGDIVEGGIVWMEVRTDADPGNKYVQIEMRRGVREWNDPAGAFDWDPSPGTHHVDVAKYISDWQNAEDAIATAARDTRTAYGEANKGLSGFQIEDCPGTTDSGDNLQDGHTGASCVGGSYTQRDGSTRSRWAYDSNASQWYTGFFVDSYDDNFISPTQRAYEFRVHNSSTAAADAQVLVTDDDSQNPGQPGTIWVSQLGLGPPPSIETVPLKGDLGHVHIGHDKCCHRYFPDDLVLENGHWYRAKRSFQNQNITNTFYWAPVDQPDFSAQLESHRDYLGVKVETGKKYYTDYRLRFHLAGAANLGTTDYEEGTALVMTLPKHTQYAEYRKLIPCHANGLGYADVRVWGYNAGRFATSTRYFPADNRQPQQHAGRDVIQICRGG